MAKTIKFGRQPTEADITWFVKNIGPRTHYLPENIGGKGWKFTKEKDNPWAARTWYLTVQDEKMLTFYLLIR